MDADPGGDCGLSEDHLDLYWLIADSRNRRGTPRLTLLQAQAKMGIKKWADFTALIDEIADAGYWQRDDYSGVKFDPDRVPPRPDSEPLPEPPGTDPEDPSALVTSHARAHAGAQVHAGTHSYKLKNSYDCRPPYGGTFKPVPGLADGRPSPRTKRWLRQDVGRQSAELVEIFSVRVRAIYFGQAVGSQNMAALGRQIRTWLNEGVDPDTIKQMIEAFVSNPQFIRKGTPAWKSFIAQRQRLLTLVRDGQERARVNSRWKRGQL